MDEKQEVEPEPKECTLCDGTGRHMGRFGHNDPDCRHCGGSGWADGQYRDPLTGKIYRRR
jgi:DnaJ-class molecular chaperone